MKNLLQNIFSIKNEYKGTNKRKILKLLFFKIKFRYQDTSSPEYLIRHNKWFYELQIETTSFCNAKCSFCPNYSLKRKKNIMSDEIFNLIIKRVKDEKLKIERFILHLNGEPLTDKKLSQRIKKLKQEFPNSEIRFTTNLCLATKENLTDVINAGLDEITVSLNSIDPTEYKKIMDLDFNKTINNLNMLFELRKKINPALKINISIVARQDNADMVEKFKTQYGNITNIRIIKLGQWVEKEKYMNCEEKNSTIHTPCNILYKTINILSNGDYALCCFEAEGIIGKNIQTTPLLKAYMSNPYKKIRTFQKRHGRINKECKNCSFS